MYEHWAEEFEDYIMNKFVERETLELDIDRSLRRGDLHAAAMQSFQHVFTSFELGDRTEAQSYMFMAAVLAEADVVFAAEEAAPDLADIEVPGEPIKFEIPKYVFKEPHEQWGPYRNEDSEDGIGWHKGQQYYEELWQKEAVKRTVAAAEDVLLLDGHVVPIEKNRVLLDAIAASCNVIFAPYREPDEYGYHLNNFQLLTLASELARYLVINKDTESTELAFDAFEWLAAAAMKTEGKTLPVLTQTLSGFKKIDENPENDDLRDELAKNIDTLTQARLFVIGRSAGLLAVHMWQAFKPYLHGTNEFGPYAKPRTSRKMQAAAEEEYKLLRKVT